MFAPSNTVLSVVVWYVALVVIPYAVLAMVRLMVLDWGPSPRPESSLAASFIQSGAAAPISEESLFRWLALYVGGPPALIFASVVVWPPLHLLRAATGLAAAWWLMPLLVLDSIFLVKLWRGRYYWLGFGFHSATNVAIAVVSTFVVSL